MKEDDFLLLAPPGMAFYNIGPNFTSMGLFGILTVLRKNGRAGSFLNANYIPKIRTYKKTLAEKAASVSDLPYWEDLEHPRWQALFDFIAKVNPKVLGITCLDTDVYPVKVIAKKAKEIRPGMVIVVGGPTPSVYPQIFSDCAEIDLLAQGEGEFTMLDIVQTVCSGKDFRDIAGTCRFEHGELKTNAPRPCIGDTEGLDSLPIADRDFYYFDPAEYTVRQDVQLDGLLTSRGCAHNCNFCCAAGIWKRKIYYRSIDSVIEEICFLREKYGRDFDNFYIHDDNFPSSIKRVGEFSAKMRNLEEKFHFRCFSRVRPLKDDTIIYSLLCAGCTEVLLGVESGSDHVLESMGKQLAAAESMEVAGLLNDYEMLWRAFFIMGTPYERLEDARRTAVFVKSIKAPISRVYCFNPYLGTDFFYKMPELGIQLDLKKILCSNQEISEYHGNLIPKDLYSSIFAEAEAAAFENIAEWEREFTLDENQTAKAVCIENTVIDFFRDRVTKPGLAAGTGRNIRWLAALLHCAFPEHAFRFFDTVHPQGRRLAFGDFIPSAEVNQYAGNPVYTIGSCRMSGIESGIQAIPVYADEGDSFPKRRVCEILYSVTPVAAP